MEKSSTEKLKSSRLMSKRMKWIIIAIVVAVLVALAFSVVFIRLKTQRKTSSSAPDTSSTVPRDSHAKEVDVVSLVGFHVGRMIARGNTTEGPQKAVIVYQLQCKEHAERNESLVRCDFTQIGCTVVMQNNGTEEDCLMEDVMFSFEVDEDGEIFTNETDVLDPARLALALYTKHLRARDCNGEAQRHAVNKTNSTHASISFSGLTLEVTELPANASSKHYHQSRRSRRNVQPNAFFAKDSRKTLRARRRRDSDSIIGGAFGQALKNSWKGGPYIKVPNLFSESKSRWLGSVRYDVCVSNFEALLSTLPDIHVTAIVPPVISVSQDGYKVKLEADFSLNQQCSDVVQSRVYVYFHVRACIWFWCFLNVKKADYVSLHLTPVVEITVTLKPKVTGERSDLQYSFAVTHLDMGTNADIGGLDSVSSDIGLIGALFGPGGLLIGFLFDRLLESVIRHIYSNLAVLVPGIVNNQASTFIGNLLPRPGVISRAGAAVVAAHMIAGLYGPSSIKLLTLELSNINGPLANAPPPFQPNKISCSGQGLIETIHDGCMNDYGLTMAGDSLEIYCFGGAKRFCLSKELCPWRNQPTAACSALYELATCSVSGLSGQNMANAWGVNYHCNRRCRGWWLWRRCWNDCYCSGSSYTDINCVEGSVQVY